MPRTSPCSQCGSRQVVNVRQVDGPGKVTLGLKCKVCRRVVVTWEGTLVEERKRNAEIRGVANKLRAAARESQP